VVSWLTMGGKRCVAHLEPIRSGHFRYRKSSLHQCDAFAGAASLSRKTIDMICRLALCSSRRSIVYHTAAPHVASGPRFSECGLARRHAPPLQIGPLAPASCVPFRAPAPFPPCGAIRLLGPSLSHCVFHGEPPGDIRNRSIGLGDIHFIRRSNSKSAQESARRFGPATFNCHNRAVYLDDVVHRQRVARAHCKSTSQRGRDDGCSAEARHALYCRVARPACRDGGESAGDLGESAAALASKEQTYLRVVGA
jgi:hypothetical protein